MIASSSVHTHFSSSSIVFTLDLTTVVLSFKVLQGSLISVITEMQMSTSHGNSNWIKYHSQCAYIKQKAGTLRRNTFHD